MTGVSSLKQGNVLILCMFIAEGFVKTVVTNSQQEYRLEDLSKLITEESDLVADQVTEIVEDLIDG